MKKLLRSFKKQIPILIGKRLLLIYSYSKTRAHEKAFRLFCTPLRGKVKPEQEAFLNEAKDLILETKTQRIQTYRWDVADNITSKGTILLIHGWDSNTYRWHNLVPDLVAADYTVVALDAPAQGYSSGKILNVPLYADCVEAMTKAYPIDYFIGHSLGGMTAIFHQYTYPNPGIKKLIVLGPPSELTRIMEGFQQTLGLTDHFMSSMDQFFKQKFNFYFREFSVAKFAKNITQQGLIIHDRLDTIAPFAASKAIHKQWKNSRLMATKNLGHSLFHVSVNEAILEFLNQ